MYIDQMDLERSMSFLKTTAMENGCFREVGKVFSSYMMGGLGRKQDDVDDTALTAFVLIALLKANVLNDVSVYLNYTLNHVFSNLLFCTYFLKRRK